jgi:LPS-assembly protein
VDNLNEIIRFDEEDAIADTNEIEYGLVNRIFRSRKESSGRMDNYEFLSLTLMQKYFFDPTFGGAFRPGKSNNFYPLDSLTGFSTTGIERNMSPATIILRVAPARGISHDARADFDTKFGLNLAQFLFGPVSDLNAQLIGETIKQSIIATFILVHLPKGPRAS